MRSMFHAPSYKSGFCGTNAMICVLAGWPDCLIFLVLRFVTYRSTISPFSFSMVALRRLRLFRGIRCECGYVSRSLKRYEFVVQESDGRWCVGVVAQPEVQRSQSALPRVQAHFVMCLCLRHYFGNVNHLQAICRYSKRLYSCL